jgi:predicted GNAT family acetyltransferase
MKDRPLPDEAIVVTDNKTAHQFEARVDGHLARLVYRLGGNIVVLTHTEVPDAIARRGIGSRLVQAALDDARDRQLRVVPQCPFVGAFIQRHPEYRALVTRHLSADQ